MDEELNALEELAGQIGPHIGPLRGTRLVSAIKTFSYAKNIFFRDPTTPRSELYRHLSEFARVTIGLSTARTLLGEIGKGFAFRERQLSASTASGTNTAETCAAVLELVRGIDRRQVEQGKTLHLIDLHTMPPIDGLEDLFKENTPVQRNMFVEGFRLLTTKQSSKPRSAAIAVFEDYQRRRVKGRYTNKESFSTQFARKWELLKSIRRL